MSHPLAGLIDHTYLSDHPDPQDHLDILCNEAHNLGAYAVCVRSQWAEFVRGILSELRSSVKVAVTVGFPDGDLDPYAIKVAEMTRVESWVDEYDVVIPVQAFKANRYTQVSEHIHHLCSAAGDKTLKVILETSLLNVDEKKKACEIVCDAFRSQGLRHGMLKTSTGFTSGGASIEDMHIMACFVSEHVGIKASGGIKDASWAEELRTATGVEGYNPQLFRIGSSQLLKSL